LTDTIVGMPIPPQGPTSLSTKQDFGPPFLIVARFFGAVGNGNLLRVLLNSGGLVLLHCSKEIISGGKESERDCFQTKKVIHLKEITSRGKE